MTIDSEFSHLKLWFSIVMSNYCTWSSVQPPQLPAWRLAGHHDDVVDLAWAQNSQFFASCSKARRENGDSEKIVEFDIQASKKVELYIYIYVEL